MDIEIAGNCVITGEFYSVVVKLDDYNRWKGGARILEAFPYLNADDREWIMSRISPTGWNKLFPSSVESQS